MAASVVLAVTVWSTALMLTHPIPRNSWQECTMHKDSSVTLLCLMLCPCACRVALAQQAISAELQAAEEKRQEAAAVLQAAEMDRQAAAQQLAGEEKRGGRVGQWPCRTREAPGPVLIRILVSH